MRNSRSECLDYYHEVYYLVWTKYDVNVKSLMVKSTALRPAETRPFPHVRMTHPDAQENVDGVGARDVTDGRVGVLILDGGHFAGERIWTQKR